MRKLRIITAIVFALTVISFGVYKLYDIIAIDDTPPIITSDSELIKCSVEGDESQYMAGITAYDNHDGDLTDSIMIEGISQLVTKDSAKITYVVFDSSNNVGRYTRYIQYTDYELPRFHLEQPLLFAKGAEIAIFEKLTASDVIDGNISDSIRVATQNIDTTEEGEYDITVQVTNSMGDTSTLPLSIIINSEDVRKPLIKLKEYITYVDVGSDINLWSYIENLYDADGDVKAKTMADITTDLDTSKEGVYEVRYTFADGKYEYTAILTVVVE